MGGVGARERCSTRGGRSRRAGQGRRRQGESVVLGVLEAPSICLFVLCISESPTAQHAAWRRGVDQGIEKDRRTNGGRMFEVLCVTLSEPEDYSSNMKYISGRCVQR